jgi:L-lactate dehydrogenase
LRNIAAEIILVDIDEARCHGEILDLSDALTFDGISKIRPGTARDASHADIIIIAAGKPQKSGESRLDLLATNKKIISDIFTLITPISKAAIVIMITNPVDVLTAFAQSISGLPHNQIFGTGTFLDTLRLRGIIAEKTNIAKSSINAYVIGEHGDSQVVAWSTAEIAGTPVAQFPGIQQKDLAGIAQQVKDTAYEIIKCKGSTHFGIAACIATLCQAIIGDQKIIVPVSTYIAEYDAVLSMPAIIGEKGIEKILSIPLNDDEKTKLKNSAEQLKSYYNKSLND